MIGGIVQRTPYEILEHAEQPKGPEVVVSA